MAAIEVVVRIDEPGVPAETLRDMVGSMQAADDTFLTSRAGKPSVSIVGALLEHFEALTPYLTGESA
jgi:hypothetical protein